MAEEKTSSSLLDPRMVLLALTLVGGGVWYNQTRLQSSRPSERMSMPRTALGDQVVPARLWQDPLEAALGYRERGRLRLAENPSATNTAASALFTVSEVTNQIARQMGYGSAPVDTNLPKLTILEVMIEGGSYAESAEARYRSRYAVLSALSVSGYVPWDEEHIGYFELCWPRSACLENIPTNSIPPLSGWDQDYPQCRCLGRNKLVVPFEWFEPDPWSGTNSNPNKKPLLVAWLRRDAFEDFALTRLAQLNHELLVGQSAGSIAVKLIDPSLYDLLHEPDRPKAGGQPQPANRFTLSDILANVDVYSSWATTAGALLSTNLETNAPRGDVLTHYFHSFTNVTCTDDQLASALIEELRLRGVVLTNDTDAVALISEWDTLYGRALPLTFAATATSRSGTNLSEGLPGVRAQWPTDKIWRYSYLRGIDGKLPGDDSGMPQTLTETNHHGQAEEPNRPEGRAQLDYLPRLARRLLERKNQSAAAGQPQLKAIGILGSDLYDKLLVLQGLRPYFRDEIFFTTDLDARLLDPSQSRWTRNLIVASSFGLNLADDLQRRIPPFRDTYQTAEYRACLTALNSRRIPAGAFTPRIFEIGRSQAYDLSGANGLGIHAPRASTGVHLINKKLLLPLGAGLVALAWVLITAFQWFRPIWKSWSKDDRFWVYVATGSVLVALTIALVLAWFIRRDSVSAVGEPFSLIEGISIWPSEIIRCCALVLSLFFLIKGLRELQRERRNLCDEFGLEASSTAKRLPGFLRWGLIAWMADDIPKGPMDSGEFLGRAGQLGTTGSRLFRAGLAAAIYAGLGFGLMIWLQPPFRPFRGHFSDACDQIIIGVSASAQILLTFFVVDATLLCRRLTRFIASGHVQWPKKTRNKFEAEMGVSRDYLNDWIGLQVIGSRSAAVGKLIFYPFVALALLILARNNYFAPWNWPVSLIIFFSANSAIAIVSVLVLRRVVEEARREALERMERHLLRALGRVEPASVIHDPETAENPNGQKGVGDAAEQIRVLIKKIEDYKEGAFAPLSQHPLIGALLLPVGGAGALAALDFFAAR